MKSESDRKRRQILDAIAELSPQVSIFCAEKGGRPEYARRDHCLRALVASMRANQPSLLCLDREEGSVDADRRVIIEQSRLWRTFEYRHMSSADEPLLWIPDAIAWSWPRGGQFRNKVEDLIDVNTIRV